MLQTKRWNRQNHLESEACPRVWEHQETNEVVKVKKFAGDDTWDATYNGRILENYDTPEEAIERGEEFLSD